MISETKHRLQHCWPEARVYFLDPKWTGSGKLREGKHIVAPDINDIININVSLNITSQPGTFTITLNNKNERYFIQDDLEREVENLNEPPLDLQETVDRSKEKNVYPYKNTLEWLNHEEFKRVFEVPGEGIYRLERYQNKKDGDIGYWKRAQDKEFLDEHAKENFDLVDEFVKLSGKDLENVVSGSSPNLHLYEKHGGMVEQGRCIFKPMDRVVILFSRRFEKVPYDFIVAFSGIVNTITDDYTENFSRLTISGEDVTKWMKVTWANVNPSLFTGRMPDAGPHTMRSWSKRFTNMEPWEIIRLLILGGNDKDGVPVRGVGEFVYDPTLGPESRLVDLKGTKETLHPGTFDYPENYLKNGDLNSLENIAKAAKSYDKGIIERDDVSNLDRLFQKSRLHLQIPIEQTQYNDLGEKVRTPYKKFVRETYDNFDNEYRTHLDIIYELAKTTFFEFYADQNGDIRYHQPRFDNHHILTADIPEVYILQNDDIVSWNFTENDAPVITSILVTGQQDYIEGDQYILSLVNFYEDKSLILKYGRRMLTVSHPFVRTSEDCYYYAQSLLYRILAERRTGSITITGRPEIKMAMPVYIPFRNMIYYVNSVSHSFSFGESFTTTLGLTYGKKPWEPLPELLTYIAHPSVDGEVGEGNVSEETTTVHEKVDSQWSKGGPLYWPFKAYEYIVEAEYGQKTRSGNKGATITTFPRGIDLKLANMTFAMVYATHAGKVKECDINYVVLESSGGDYETHYYGLAMSLNVNSGDTINEGQEIGAISTKTLRYCLKRKNEGFVNPEKYTKAKLSVRGGGTKS